MKRHFVVGGAVLLALATFLVFVVPLHAQSPDFTITSTPLETCVNPGGSASYLTTVSSVNGFEGNVSLVESVDPIETNGPALSPISSNVSLTIGQSVAFNLTASTAQATPARVYTITIIGGTADTVHSATIYLSVQFGCGAVGGTLLSVNNVGLLVPFAGFAVAVVGLATGTMAVIYTRRSRVR